MTQPVLPPGPPAPPVISLPPDHFPMKLLVERINRLQNILMDDNKCAAMFPGYGMQPASIAIIQAELKRLLTALANG